MVAMMDIAKLAGLLEGEGSFTVAPRDGRHPVPRVQFCSTDEDVTVWVATMVGRRIVYRQPPKAYGAIVGTKPQFSVVEQGARAAGLMMTMYPFLHSRRRARIREILTAWRAAPSHAGGIASIRHRLFGFNPRPTCHPERKRGGGGLCAM